MFALGSLLGLLICFVAAFLLPTVVLGDPLWAAPVCLAAGSLASLSLPGGGMVVSGVVRLRWFHLGWTLDGDRSPLESFASGLLLGFVCLGGGLLPVPLFTLVAWLFGLPALVDVRLATVVAAAPVLLLALRPRHVERPLWHWAEEARRDEPGDEKELASRLEWIASITRADGVAGHIGGLGAEIAGLHEHVDSMEVVALAARRGVARAAARLDAMREALLRRALPTGGWSTYPGAGFRTELSFRCLLLLHASGRPIEGLDRHLAALQPALRADGWARSAKGRRDAEASEWATRWAGRGA